jgi:hypothetical protein
VAGTGAARRIGRVVAAHWDHTLRRPLHQEHGAALVVVVQGCHEAVYGVEGDGVGARPAARTALLDALLVCGFRRRSATASDLKSAGDSGMKSAILI